MRRKDKSKQKKQRILSIAMVTLLLLSIAGFIANSTVNNDSGQITREYSGKKYKFTLFQTNFGEQYYEVSSEDAQFSVSYLPEALVSLNIKNNAQDKIIDADYFYFVFDPKNSELGYVDQLRLDLRTSSPSSVFFQEGITQTSETYNLPILDCGNSTPNIPVILVRNSTDTNITANGNCVIMEFPPYEILRIRDFLVYSLYDIKIGDTNG